MISHFPTTERDSSGLFVYETPGLEYDDPSVPPLRGPVIWCYCMLGLIRFLQQF